MIHYFTRIASLVLAFGFFISCSSLQSSTQKSDNTPSLSKRQIQQQIDSLDKQLNAGSNSADLYYQKGKLLTKLAQKQNHPSQRTSPYTQAYQSLTKAADLFSDSSNAESERVEELLKVTWSIEHNQGVKIMQGNTTGTPDFMRAAAHFNNATIVIPDSAISYEMQARAYYKGQQPDQAIKVLEEARQKVNDVPSVLEQLAYLYLESDQPQKAVTIYEQAESFSDQNLNLLHGLSNAYINADEHQKAVELLEQLIESKPENIIYAQTLATELYFIADQHLDTVESDLRSGQKIGNTKFKVADSLLNRAEKQFTKILDTKPEDQEIQQSVATFYHNVASKYQQLLPFVEQTNKQQLDDKIKKYLSSSIPLLEQLTQQNPENKPIWHKLYQAYSYLGMESEARKAKSNL